MITNRIRTIRLQASDMLVIIVLLIISLVLELLLVDIDFNLNDKISIIVIFAGIVYVSVYLSARKGEKRLSYFRIFLLFSFLFYFGQHILVLFNSVFLHSTTRNTIISGRVEDKYVVIGSFFILQTILLLYFGYCIGKQNNCVIDDVYYSEEASNIDDAHLKTVFYVFFLATAIPAFVIAVYRMGLTSVMGYSDLRDIDDTVYKSGGTFILICSYLQGWFLPSIYMLLISERKRMRTILYIVLIIYCVLYVLSGSRFTILKILVAVVLIEYEWRREIRIKELIRYGIVLVFIALAFSVIGNIRGMIISQNFADAFKSNLSSYPISSILWETGITFHSVSNILQHCPSDAPFIYGKSVLGALFICLPSFMRFNFVDLDAFTTSKIFSPYFYGFIGVGYGSSFIAEGYHNFGYMFLLVSVIYGYVLGRMELSAYKSVVDRNPYVFFVLVCAFSEFAYCIRTDLWAVPRAILFYAVIPLLIVKITRIRTR